MPSSSSPGEPVSHEPIIDVDALLGIADDMERHPGYRPKPDVIRSLARSLASLRSELEQARAEMVTLAKFIHDVGGIPTPAPQLTGAEQRAAMLLADRILTTHGDRR